MIRIQWKYFFTTIVLKSVFDFYMKLVLSFLFVALLFTSKSFAQYVNTDELMIVPGIENPVTLEQYEKIKEHQQSLYQSYLSQFLVPGNGGYIISGFGPRSGRMHYGTDIKMERGDTVLAVNDGYISRAGWGTGFGNLIVIQHTNQIETYYAHLSKFLKNNGDWVHKGEPIALAGSTGRARGPHLHFEMHESGHAFDPELVYDFGKQEIRGTAQNFETLTALHRTLKPQGYGNNLAVPEYYKVRSGDSLWVISRRYKTPIKDICRLNNISENTVLQIGQPLKMY